jgi:hypothetical protein
MFLGAALIAMLLQSSGGLAQPQHANYSRVYRAPQSQAPAVRAPIMHAPIIRAPVAPAPASSQVRSGGAPVGPYIRPSLPVTAGAPMQQPRIIHAGPRIIRVPPAVSTSAGVVNRPIARRVLVHGRFVAVPAIVIVGAPFVLDVPDVGLVYVPENEYAEIYDLLTSDNPDDVERGYLRLQELAGR